MLSYLQEIASYLGLELGKINIKRFADGEIYVQLQESVRGCDVFLVQPTCPPANENLMELLIMIDACRRASAKNITAVIPYFGYARADRKVMLSTCHTIFCLQIILVVLGSFYFLSGICHMLVTLHFIIVSTKRAMTDKLYYCIKFSLCVHLWNPHSQESVALHIVLTSEEHLIFFETRIYCRSSQFVEDLCYGTALWLACQN